MKINKINLVNFRNYEDITIDGFLDLNVFVGQNGQGKTNLLESILLLSTTRSQRDASNLELISFDKEHGRIIGWVDSIKGPKVCKVVFSKQGKYLEINNNEIRKISDYIGQFNVVIFDPNDLYLLDAMPKNRRKFLDLELGKISHSYLLKLIEYNSLLKNRNLCLKEEQVDRILLQTLTDQLIVCTISIVEKRFKFLKLLEKKAKKFFDSFGFSFEDFKIRYETFCDYSDDRNQFKSQLELLYQNSLEKDILFKTTNIGIHRDDFKILVDDKPFVGFASQGQKRLVILCLKLALLEIIYDVCKEFPVLLLDDVFSELDSKRQEILVSLIPDGVQTFITTTNFTNDWTKLRNLKIYKINNGLVSY